MPNFSTPAHFLGLARHRGWFSILKMVARTFQAEGVVLCVREHERREAEDIHFLGVVQKIPLDGTPYYVECRRGEPILENSFSDCLKVLDEKNSFCRCNGRETVGFFGVPFEDSENRSVGVLGIIGIPDEEFTETQIGILDEAQREFQASIPAYLQRIESDATREISDPRGHRNSRNMLQRAMKLGRIAYWVCDVERDLLISCSATLFPMLGLSEQEFEQHEHELIPLLKRVVHPDDFEELWDQYIHAGESGNHAAFRVVMPDGMIFHYFLSATPIKDHDGQVVSRIAVVQDVTDQKIVETTLLEQEKELRDKERRYRMLYDHSSDAIYVVDGDLIIECNRRTLEIFGYPSHEDFFGSNIQFLSAEFQPDGRKSSDVLGERFRRAIQGETEPFEWLSRRKDGSVFETVITLAPLFGDKPVVQVIVHDLTEQKTAVRAMENYRAYISLLAEIRKAFYSRSEQEIVQAFLDTAVNYFNLRKAWYGMRIGNTIRPVYHAGPDKEFLDIARVRMNPKAGEVPFPLALAVHERRPLALNNLRKNPEFAPWAPFAAEANFHSALAIPVEAQNRIEGGVVFYSRMPHAFDESIVDYLHGSLKELVHISSEKRRWSLQQRTLKKAKETAEAAALAKSRFLANMSHEIRTPMTSILGYTEMLQRDHLARIDGMKPEELTRDFYENIIEQCRSTTRIIRNNAEFLLSILNDILDYSKMDAEKMTFEMLDVPIVPVLKELSAFYSVQAKKKGLDFSIKSLTTLPAVMRTDPVRVKQILVNLVGNAIKFTLKGEIVVSVAWVMEEYLGDVKPEERDKRDYRDTTEKPFRAGNLFFSIKDTGIGISSAQLSSLMTPFHQADPSTTRRFGGTGLGLAISKRLIQLLGGELLISSQEGEGSTFTVILPQRFEGENDWKTIDEIEREISERNPSGVSDELEEDSRLAGHPLVGLRILLAEDGKDNQRLFSFILEKAGAEVHVADNGRVALDLASENMRNGCPFDVILMDMQMPVMDGYTTTRRLRNGGYAHPIIALTAHALVEERQKCIAAGCDDYATKPILRNALLETILKNVASKASRK